MSRLLVILSPCADYPHWQMVPELKRYYLMQAAYWCQQLIVLVLGLEKPRKDYMELTLHHIVTLWLVGCVLGVLDCCDASHHFCSWSYLVNLTLIGNAIYLSMDIPDAFLAVRTSRFRHCFRADRSPLSMIVLENPQLYPMGKDQGRHVRSVLGYLDVRTLSVLPALSI